MILTTLYKLFVCYLVVKPECANATLLILYCTRNFYDERVPFLPFIVHNILARQHGEKGC